MYWDLEYKRETGNDACYEVEDPHNCNRTDMVPSQNYIDWLEEKCTKLASQQSNSADTKKACDCGCHAAPVNDCPEFTETGECRLLCG